jgi:hypothetical protein
VPAINHYLPGILAPMRQLVDWSERRSRNADSRAANLGVGTERNILRDTNMSSRPGNLRTLSQ